MYQYKILVLVFCWPSYNTTRNSAVSLRFNSHFPGEPGLDGVYWSKGWWRRRWQLDDWSYKSCKAPVKSSPPTNQHPVFYRPNALPVAQPTVSRHWREKYHIPWTCLPQAHLGDFQLCLWPLLVTLGEGCHASHQPSDASTPNKNSAIADKPRYAFIGQSRSPNMVPFDVLGMLTFI